MAGLIHWKLWDPKVPPRRHLAVCGVVVDKRALTVLGSHATCPVCLDAWRAAEVEQALRRDAYEASKR